jgi:type IV secretory pathway VirB10-like protein
MPVVDTAKYDKIKETERTSNDIKKKIKDAYIKQEAEKAKPMDKFKEIGKKAPKPPKPPKESNESTEHLKHIKNEMEIKCPGPGRATILGFRRRAFAAAGACGRDHW